ncbi:MAG: hypothetical protein JSW61_00375 [Candidatus Thorarchaeota archaeon]|nr:MAG: hypothetical protein JSW61_00375 [Candidatus Thorarchaeota archaeon]
MAEEFLGRLTKLEERLEKLDESLKRMITVLGEVTEVKSEIRVAKDEIIEALKSQAPAEPTTPATEELLQAIKTEIQGIQAGGASDEALQALSARFEEFSTQVTQMFEAVRVDLTAAMAVAPQPAAPVSAPAPAPTEAPAAAAEEPVAGSPAAGLSLDVMMRIAEHLDGMIESLKMGCKAGPVLDMMTESREEILKIVPSDQITIRIDKWIGVVGAYPKRNELQAKDILKLKKEIKAEIPKYRPA